MLRNFNEVEELVSPESASSKKRIVVCGAHDKHALEAFIRVKRKGLADGVLVGDQTRIMATLREMEENPLDFEIIDAASSIETSKTSVALVASGQADIEMKGGIPSADFLLPIMDPFDGLVGFDGLMSECTVFYNPDQKRLQFATDCALTVTPTFEQKIKLVENAVQLARAFEFDTVKVAGISALERVNPDIPSTVEAAKLAERDWGNGVEFAGPFALDNALDEATARAKGIESPVAGHADVLLMPDLCTGNVFHKCIHYFGHMPSAGVMCGTSKPVVFTSRSDSADAKYYSILCALLQARANEG